MRRAHNTSTAARHKESGGRPSDEWRHEFRGRHSGVTKAPRHVDQALRGRAEFQAHHEDAAITGADIGVAGDYLWKIPKSKSAIPELRFFMVTHKKVPGRGDIARLTWWDSDFRDDKPRHIELQEVSKVVLGHGTKAFQQQQHKGEKLPAEHLSFSLVAGTRTVDLGAESLEDLISWLKSLRPFIPQFDANQPVERLLRCVDVDFLRVVAFVRCCVLHTLRLRVVLSCVPTRWCVGECAYGPAGRLANRPGGRVDCVHDVRVLCREAGGLHDPRLDATTHGPGASPPPLGTAEAACIFAHARGNAPHAVRSLIVRGCNPDLQVCVCVCPCQPTQGGGRAYVCTCMMVWDAAATAAVPKSFFWHWLVAPVGGVNWFSLPISMT